MIYKCWLFDYQISTKLWKAYWYVLLRNTYTCNGPKIPITYLSSSDFSLNLSVLSVFFLKFQPDRKKSLDEVIGCSIKTQHLFTIIPSLPVQPEI